VCVYMNVSVSDCVCTWGEGGRPMYCLILALCVCVNESIVLREFVCV